VEDHLTYDARRSLLLARQEARSLNHHMVGTAHLLLGLVRMVAEGSTATGVEALRSLLRGTSEDAIRVNVTRLA
jgi:hypothetical protein